MKRLLLVAVILGAAAVVSMGAQDGRYDGRRPFSLLAASIDTDRDGTISHAEIGLASTALTRLDADGDGRLTLEEMRPPFAPDGRRAGPPPQGGDPRGAHEAGPAGGASLGGGASPGDLAETLMAFDANGDGTLARAEVPERFLGLFERADSNKDGALTRDELEQRATASVQEAARGGRDGRSGRGRPDPLLRALDTDGDGALSGVEMAGATTSLLVLDANRDGQLTPDELRPAPGSPNGFDGERR